MPGQLTEIYTDGSCHTQKRIGAWVAIVLTGTEKKILSGIVENTTHNRMELLAVIKALEFVKNTHPGNHPITVFSDSQYVIKLSDREEKLLSRNFQSSKGIGIQNADLVTQLLALFSTLPVELIKVKAHLRKTGTENYNIEADKLSRKMVREASNKIGY
jgi:ribonuclease HI